MMAAVTMTMVAAVTMTVLAAMTMVVLTSSYATTTATAMVATTVEEGTMTAEEEEELESLEGQKALRLPPRRHDSGDHQEAGLLYECRSRCELHDSIVAAINRSQWSKLPTIHLRRQI